MASSGIGDHPNLNLTSEEKQLFGRLFKQADTKGDGIVTGEVAVSLFPKAKLSENTLGEIWAMADIENRGFLLQEDFAKAMRLIGHFQSNPRQPLSNDIALRPCPPGYPKFEGINMGPGAAAATAAAGAGNANVFDEAGGSPAVGHPPQGFPLSQGIQPQNSGSVRVPPLTPDRVADYTRLFESAGVKPGGTLDGEKARMFFQRSGLPNMALAQVWNLADTEQRSALSLSEFIIAMHLLASYRNGSISALPSTLPAGLIEAASRRPTQAASIPRQFSGHNAGRTSSPLARQAFGPPQPAPVSDWVIGPEEKSGFDTLFNRLDTHNASFITGVQAVEFFSQSELPQESLAAIWDLATIRGQDQLNRDEFAVAMYLIRDQRGKAKPDLPARLPANLIPPSLRGQVKPSIAPQPGFAPPLAQPQKPPSAAEDLFGLDALSASPTQASQPVQQQTTGGSGSVSRPFDDPFSNKSSSPTAPNFGSSSPRAATSHFKPFIPSSSFGQGLATQNTGGSGTSSQAPQSARDYRAPPSALDDLLGDNDESSKKITNETSELANMSNQIGILRNQMQDVQSKKTTTEADLANTNNQKRDLELRLGQFRTQYEQEARAVKELDEQLTAVRNDTRRIQQDLALLEAGYQDLQTQHRQAAAALDNERRENATLKERIRVINAEVAQLKPQLEQLQKDTRGEKGRVSINKKEVERSEAARDSVKAEIDDLSRSVPEAKNVPLPEAASDLASPAASTASAKGNPFFRKSPQPSFDNSMSPGGFGQQSRGAPGKDSPNITNIFGPSFGGTPVTSPPATSFRSDPFPTEPSVTSSEPGLPTPSASPHPSEAPPPPASRQITSNDLPLPGPRPDTAASSVRVETPTSRISGLETPTNPGSASPAPAVNDRPYASRQDTQSSTGVAIFDRAASPVASVTSNASRGGKSINQDFFSTFPTSSAPIPGAFPEPTPMEANKTGESAFSDRSKQSTPFGFPGRQDTSKSDFDSAFASVGGPKVPARQGSSHGEAGPPKKKFESEFPPIETHEGPDSDSDEDAQGFGDSFTTASPPRQKGAGVNEPKEAVGGSSFFGSQPPASELPRPDAQKSPPSYNTAAGGSGRVGSQDFPSEFGGLLPSRENPLSSPTQEAQSPSVGTRGDALFGGSSKTASAAPTSTFSTFSASPPPTSGTPASTTGTHSDAFHSAPTHPNTERDSSSTQKSHGGFNDDFDADFDALGPERGDDDGGDDDFVFGSGSGARGQDDEWNPHFDSPAASKTGTMHSERTPTGTAGQSKSSGFDDFDAFGSGFSNKPAGAGQSSTLGNSAITDTSKDEWEDMFSSISGAGKDSNAGIKGFDENEPFGSSSAGGVGGPPAAPEVPSFPEAPEAPEAPMPPKLGRTVTESSVHDVDDVKKLVKMGFPRQLVVSALEKYDYDFNKAFESLTLAGRA